MLNQSLGKVVILVGAILIACGLILLFWNRIPLLGKLPGDISFKRGNFQFFFPIVTCLIISLLLTIVLNLITRFLK